MTDEPNNSRPIRTTTARRGARRGLRRSKMLSLRSLSREEIEEARLILEAFEHFRPRHRGECRNAPRPCPWVSCKYHLYLDIVQQSGSIKLNFPDLEVWEMAETCALDVADRGGITLEEVGTLLNLTRERIRQVEQSGVEKLQTILGDEDDRELDHDEETLFDDEPLFDDEDDY
ncbi:MAG: sigma factor-like helix-turn-helix DNA-binding protein [Bradymonadales bacterium]|jgi:short subunit dehydrogenase-like uncharacterized protein